MSLPDPNCRICSPGICIHGEQSPEPELLEIDRLRAQLGGALTLLAGVRKTIRHFLESETSTVHVLWEQRLREAADGELHVVSKLTADLMVVAERRACAAAAKAVSTVDRAHLGNEYLRGYDDGCNDAAAAISKRGGE